MFKAAEGFGLNIKVRSKVLLRHPLHQVVVVVNKVKKAFAWGKLYRLHVPFITQDHYKGGDQSAQPLHLRRGHGADPVEALDRQRRDELGSTMWRDDANAVGLVLVARQLRDE